MLWIVIKMVSKNVPKKASASFSIPTLIISPRIRMVGVSKTLIEKWALFRFHDGEP